MMSERAFRFRVAVVGVLMLLPLTAVLGRAAYLQLGHGEQLKDLAEDHYLQELTLSAPRGNIVDRVGRPLAVSLKVPSIFAEARVITDPAVAAKDLAKILKLPAPAVEKKLRSGRGFVWIARRVTPEMAQAVRALNLHGIGITDESKRFYPNRELAAHVLGYTGIDGEGLEGLEKAYNSRLEGKKKPVEGFRDARGGRLLLGEFEPTELLVGDEVTLTLDSQIQFIAQQAVARAVEQHGAAAGFAIVMDPSTGAVLAMANHPTFNPNDVSSAPMEARKNRAIADSFEPGSTMKVMLLASALSHGLVRLNDLINCENGVYRVGRHRIRDTHPAELLSVADVLKHSSNIGALKIGTKLGRQRWGEALRAFGFGKRTGLGLAGETPGLMAPSEKWSDAALATISFGQGISVNGLQLVSAVAAVAHGGVLMQPYLVEKTASADGKTVEITSPQVLGQVVSQRAARLTMTAMERVAVADGTAPLAAVPGVTVAGKTGTAQKVDPGTKGYGAGRIASFIGVVPSNDPKLVIYVVIDEPKDSPYGGIVAAPAFREIAMAALPLMGVGIDPPPPPKEVARKVEAPVTSVDSLAGARALAAKLAEDDPVDGIDEGLELAGSEEALVPNLVGMTARAAIREALKNGLEPAVDGAGSVITQKPEAGKAVGAERHIKITLGRTGGNG